jgi:hypothetical protein
MMLMRDEVEDRVQGKRPIWFIEMTGRISEGGLELGPVDAMLEEGANGRSKNGTKCKAAWTVVDGTWLWGWR